MNSFYNAALSHWRSKKDESIATLELYFSNSVGIGEHSAILDEINKWTNELSQADDNIKNLEIYFNSEGKVIDKNKKAKVRPVKD
ncbi:MAG: hypothetical protein CBC38_00650 [Gammaproteobacteria bacterium TMED78]|nr:MAG: hypothetical protein CBC38_00650 [Gammaproteobacteria bacterium TMED78]|tara:strand:- start:75309 stop:75563 length:255 start_codon:yes stop_codon:yes gene_type:complete